MMTLETPICPACGQPAIGTVERVRGIATFVGNPKDGAVEYTGETKLDWDTCETVIGGDGKPLVCCAEDHWWESELFDAC